MREKSGPYIFIVVLIVVLFFILGFRYGQKVEKTNKTIDYLISQKPTTNPTRAPIEYKSYVNKGCGISFLYPNTLKIEKNASDTAVFSQDKKTVLRIDCSKNNIPSPTHEIKTATEEITLKNKKIIVNLSLGKQESLYEFSLRNPQNLKNINILIDKNFYPLFEKSLEFSNNL